MLRSKKVKDMRILCPKCFVSGTIGETIGAYTDDAAHYKCNECGYMEEIE